MLNGTGTGDLHLGALGREQTVHLLKRHLWRDPCYKWKGGLETLNRRCHSFSIRKFTSIFLSL